MRAIFTLFFVFPILCTAQITITGTILDDLGAPMIGASIQEVATSNGTTADLNGDFIIQIFPGATLRFSMVGYAPKQQSLTASTYIKVVLEPDENLEEVVVTAFGLSKEERELSYATSTQSGEALTYGRATNAGNALAGMIAGLNITGLATGPGGSSRAVLRGYNSISAANQPLYVIDGIPINNDNLGAPNQNGGVDYGDGIGSINPSDIESISVLKGHAASALYGSRARTGVILITTKKGKKGIGVDFNINHTWDRALVNMDLQQNFGQGWGPGRPSNVGEANGSINAAWGDPLDGSATIQFDGVTRRWLGTGDRFDEFYRTGSNLAYNVSLHGGYKNSTVRFGFSDLQSNAILPNSTYDRKNFTVAATTKVTNWLSFQANGQYILEDGLNRPNVAGFGLNPNLSLAGIGPNVPLSAIAGENGDGSRADGTELAVGFMNNPYWSMYRTERTDDKARTIASIQADLNFGNGFYGLLRYGNDRYVTNRFEITPEGTLYQEAGAVNDYESEFETWTANALFGYKNRRGDFGYDVFGGVERYETKGSFKGIFGNGFNTPELYTVDNLINQVPYDGPLDRRRTNAIFGSAVFSWKSYLYATITARNDYFSTLPVENAAQFFPSAGLSFLLSDAVSMPEWVSMAKLRGSWGRASSGTSAFQTDLYYRQLTTGHLGLPLSAIDGNTVPPFTLKPLLSEEVEFGFDFRAFKNRLGLDVAVYTQQTRNDLTFVQVSNASGFTNALTNDGAIQNRGIEVQFQVEPIRRKRWNWNVNFNIAKNWNEVTNLGQGVDNQQLAVTNSQALGFVHNVLGQPASAIMGFAYARDDAGNILYNVQRTLDSDGNVVSQDYRPVQGEYKVLGQGVHDLVGGINNRISYKNLSLDFLIDFKTGGDIFTGSNAWLTGLGYSQETALARLYDYPIIGVDAATGEAINTTYSFNDDATNNDCYVCHFSAVKDNISEAFVHDADFAKLRQLALTWQLPRKWTAGIKSNQASVSVVGRNLALLYSSVPNVDPESSYLNGNAQGLEFFGLPPTRSFVVDFRIGF